MSDFNALHVIEALRSGVPSRAVGEYFSEARPALTRKLRERMAAVRETGHSDGMIITGRYGEGKTHLLNTAFNMAFEANMAVSFVSLGKETPVDKPWLLYRKLMAGTYLPNAGQPGFRARLEDISAGSSAAGDLLAYAARELETDKLYYLLYALLGTQDDEERNLFLADLEGDFVSGALIKRSYRRITGKPARFNQTFSKSRHWMDYFAFVSHLFRLLGCEGWVILFDEAELVGRMGKRARAKSYREMQCFLHPSARMEKVFSLFALSSSFAEDVIDKKHEFDNVQSAFSDDPESLRAAQSTLQTMLNAPELAPLNKTETIGILRNIQDFHGRAYDWRPDVSPEAVYEATEAGGYLLRTKIRGAIEFFDQLYQYGQAGQTQIAALGRESFDEDDDDTPGADDSGS